MDHLKSELFQAHPWHGIAPGLNAPEIVHAFIELVPTDVVKYEVHKSSGHLSIDRPQLFSSQCPALYGFIPQTYCGKGVAEMASLATGRSGIKGDGDPLDICVLTERPITHGGILLSARPIGGLRMIDRNEADDKIIAVLHNDNVYGHWRDLKDCPENLLDRLNHYFLTYKDLPGNSDRKAEIAGLYNAEAAREVILKSVADYQYSFKSQYDAYQDLISKK